MGVSALTLGSLMGGATFASNMISGASQRSQAQANAAAQQAQANALRAQANLQRQQGDIEAQATDKERMQLRREYEARTGRNLNLLSAANVDLSSGSAMGQAMGSADAYAADMGENAYQRALRLWENENLVRSTMHQADSLEAQAKAQKRQSQNWFPSILSAALSGTSSFLSGYTLAGGKIGLKK